MMARFTIKSTATPNASKQKISYELSENNLHQLPQTIDWWKHPLYFF